MFADRIEAGRGLRVRSWHPAGGHLHPRWLAAAVVVGLVLSAASARSIDFSDDPTRAASAASSQLAPPTAELAYARVPPWPAGSRTPRSGSAWTVVYLGDSIAVTTTDELRAALPGWRVIPRSFCGTAPCDWAGPDLAEFFAAVRPDLVVFSFMGNSITACTAGQRGDALLDAYRVDLVGICRVAAPARCVAVGQPTLGPAVERTLPGPDEPTSMFRHHAFLGHWGFVDAGAATETLRGAFDPAMRDPDGVHLSTPGAAAYVGALAAYLVHVTTPRASLA